MAIRIRKDRKTIVCAAISEEKEGDIYLNDEIHYCLSEELGVLRTDNNGNNWHFDVPKKKKFSQV